MIRRKSGTVPGPVARAGALLCGLSPIFLAAALVLSLASHAQTNVYRWVDKDGKVHFSDTPPPKDAKDSSQKRMGGGAVAAPQVPFATQEAARRNPVTMYSSTQCGELCDQGRALLGKRGVPFSEKYADVDAKDGEAVKEMTGKLQVPVLKVGDRHVQGYREDLWNSALDAAGYAKTALPGQNTPPPPPAPPAPPPVQAPAAAPSQAAPNPAR